MLRTCAFQGSSIRSELGRPRPRARECMQERPACARPVMSQACQDQPAAAAAVFFMHAHGVNLKILVRKHAYTHMLLCAEAAPRSVDVCLFELAGCSNPPSWRAHKVNCITETARLCEKCIHPQYAAVATPCQSGGGARGIDIDDDTPSTWSASCACSATFIPAPACARVKCTT